MFFLFKFKKTFINRKLIKEFSIWENKDLKRKKMYKFGLFISKSVTKYLSFNSRFIKTQTTQLAANHFSHNPMCSFATG